MTQTTIMTRKFCPFCAEELHVDDGPFCSKHGDVSGLKDWRYNMPFAQLSAIYTIVFLGV